MAVSPPVCDFGWKAPDFQLPDTDGTPWNIASLQGPSGLLLMFICNHCPYVMSVIDRLCRDVAEVQQLGFGAAAIMSNDTDAYPEDSYGNMRRLARQYGFSFPYLFDATQEVARAYGAAWRKQPVQADGSYAVDHTTATYVVAPDGRLAAVLDLGTPAERIVAAIRKYL